MILKTDAEVRVFQAVLDYAGQHLGEWFQPEDVFPERSNWASAQRRTMGRLFSDGYFREAGLEAELRYGGWFLSKQPTNAEASTS